MIVLGLCLLTAVALRGGAPDWLCLVLGLPALFWAQGLGWARILIRRQLARSPEAPPITGLQMVLDACWISTALVWLEIALVRELGLRGDAATWGLLGLCLLAGLPGAALGRRSHAAPSPRRELLGAAAVFLAVLLSATWRHADLVRPLDAYWWMPGADAEGHETLPLAPAPGLPATVLGWPEARAVELSLPEGPTRVALLAEGPARGRLLLAVRGPLGSEVRVGDQVATVVASVQEEGEERPVRRYLDKGTAGLAVPVDLQAGERLELQVQGERLYVLPGTEALWSAHAVGALRYTHYWQILNQVENLEWANELLDWRWLTVHQPPGWSPLLAASHLLGDDDLPSNNLLFVWVLALVGLSAVRLASLVGKGAPVLAWIVPAGMVAVHALLMFEPGSTNYPDSLYTAALLGAVGALAAGRPSWFAALAIGASLLRYPGVVACTLFAFSWWATGNGRPWAGLLRLSAGLGLGALLAAALVLAGALPDLGFILYFETFPEHWHDDYALSSLLPRVDDFYRVLLRYTGGGALLALPFLLGPASPARRGGRFVLLGLCLYSLLLCTIDHHPTHYFLPLVAFTGPVVVAAAASVRQPLLRWGLPVLILGGLWITLSRGQVF